MGKIDITRTELVWPGKYDENGRRKEIERVQLPFQIIETINETRATREAKKKPQQIGLFDVWEAKEGDTFEEGWRNKLIWGENKYIMSSLMEKFAGKIDLIYIDPPFATGADFSFNTEIGETGLQVYKEQSMIEQKAYRDTWGRDKASYLGMMRDRLTLMRELLAEYGSILVHTDWHVGHMVKLLLDEIFGEANFLNEIVWYYRNVGLKVKAKKFHSVTESIFWYGKSAQHKYREIYEKRDKISRQPLVEWDPVRRKTVTKKDENGKVIYVDLTHRRVQNLWNIPRIAPTSGERANFATQKPEALLERAITAFSDEGDLVADFFCGSGTTCAVAEKLGRRWIGADLSRYAIHVSRKRLLDIEGCKPFEILNLGKYERKYWQAVTFAKGRKRTDQEMTIFEYLALILKLYRAQPVSGMQHLHGKKGSAVVHIGAVDAPVTIDEINACLDECTAIGQKELHVLGWEWEMGLYDIITDAAKGRGIKLVMLNIPREVMEQQAVEKGDIRFSELAYLEVDIKQSKGGRVTVALKDFVIPNTELIPQEVREKVKKWSDYIDYWAVDLDFQSDTFMNGWVTYRTRRDRTLTLKSDAHTYDHPGKYTIMVKVIDIFGIDTSQAFEVEVK